LEDIFSAVPQNFSSELAQHFVLFEVYLAPGEVPTGKLTAQTKWFETCW
jgi:hypothetical protein